MRVSVFATSESVIDSAHTVRECFAVVIDVLRATSTIITALNHGARSVIPAVGVPEAITIFRALDGDSALLCGERHGVRIPGFDLGNSPLEYAPETVGGRTLVMTTTNGTRAIAAVKDAAEAVMGGFLNAASVARRASRSGLPVTLVMAGTNGRFSLDDALATGAILDALPGAEPDDLGRVCYSLYRENQTDLIGALRHCSHYHTLAALGFVGDIAWCVRRDVMDTVPVFVKDRIVAG
jgi:2-phosphosulfolactate phosphatase